MTDEIRTSEPSPTRRGLFGLAIGAAAGGVALLASATSAEAKRGGRGGGWGAPPGWSRGRKMGWRKKGGPKWRW
jgi:hypothetical protein